MRTKEELLEVLYEEYRQKNIPLFFVYDDEKEGVITTRTREIFPSDPDYRRVWFARNSF